MFREKINNSIKIKTIIFAAVIIFSLSAGAELSISCCGGINGKTECNHHYNVVNNIKYHTISKTRCSSNRLLCDLRNFLSNAKAILKTNNVTHKIHKQNSYTIAPLKQRPDLQYERAGPLFLTYKSTITCPLYLINRSFRC
jgi:hypothetical protein